MSADAQVWLWYAEENFKTAAVCLESELFNASLQNSQQAVEKALKSVLTCQRIPFQKTHDILTLNSAVIASNHTLGLSDDEAELLNSIYLPSKYPLGSPLARYEPDLLLATQVYDIAKHAFEKARTIVMA